MSLKEPFKDKEWKLLEDEWEEEFGNKNTWNDVEDWEEENEDDFVEEEEYKKKTISNKNRDDDVDVDDDEDDEDWSDLEDFDE